WDIDLGDHTVATAKKLRDLLSTIVTVPRVRVRINDVERWLAILAGDNVRCKRVKDFAPMLKQFLKTAPKHWVYETREHSESYQPYYVSNVEYHPPEKSRHGGTIPAHVDMELHWEELGEYHAATESFYAEHCED